MSTAPATTAPAKKSGKTGKPASPTATSPDLTLIGAITHASTPGYDLGRLIGHATDQIADEVTHKKGINTAKANVANAGLRLAAILAGIDARRGDKSLSAILKTAKVKISASRQTQLLRCGECLLDLVTVGLKESDRIYQLLKDTHLPTSESVTRPLTRLGRDQRRRVWAAVWSLISTATDGEPSWDAMSDIDLGDDMFDIAGDQVGKVPDVPTRSFVDRVARAMFPDASLDAADRKRIVTRAVTKAAKAVVEETPIAPEDTNNPAKLAPLAGQIVALLMADPDFTDRGPGKVADDSEDDREDDSEDDLEHSQGDPESQLVGMATGPETSQEGPQDVQDEAPPEVDMDGRCEDCGSEHEEGRCPKCEPDNEQEDESQED